jgi:peptidyl-tRNA hydrolase, PTH1 family
LAGPARTGRHPPRRSDSRQEHPWLVAGLGNPGEKYAATRHNIGAMVLSHLVGTLDARLRKVRFLPALGAEVRYRDVPMLLVLPGTWMNLSGPPIASFARRRGVPVERVVVCHDDLDLTFGALRVKKGGSTAGHHGLGSLVQAFSSPDFYRVRLGVGRPPGRKDPIDFVLEPFAKSEREQVELLVRDGADAALSLVTEGLGVTQSRYNRGGVRES